MSKVESYKTIKTVSSSEFLEKRSRFISYAYPVDSEEMALSIIKKVQAEYYDARHVCRAYRIGYGDHLVEKSSDDGEPSGTAGRPILGRLLSHDLTNVLIVVIRYFGGVKLGPSGLIAAYKMGAETALENAEVCEVILNEVVDIVFDYDSLGGVMRITKEAGGKILAQNHGENCQIKVEIAVSGMDEYCSKISALSHKVKVKIED